MFYFLFFGYFNLGIYSSPLSMFAFITINKNKYFIQPDNNVLMRSTNGAFTQGSQSWIQVHLSTKSVSFWSVWIQTSHSWSPGQDPLGEVVLGAIGVDSGMVHMRCERNQDLVRDRKTSFPQHSSLFTVFSVTVEILRIKSAYGLLWLTSQMTTSSARLVCKVH